MRQLAGNILLDNPSDAYALYWRGQAERFMDRPDEAVPFLQRSFDIQKNSEDDVHFAPTALALGIALQLSDELLHAATVLEEAVARKPERSVLWNSLGVTYRKLEQYDNALKAYERGMEIELFSALKRAKENGYWGVNATGKPTVWFSADSAKAVHAELQKDPLMAQLLTNVAHVLIEKGERDRSILCLFRAMTLAANERQHTEICGELDYMQVPIDEKCDEKGIKRNAEVFFLGAINAVARDLPWAR